MDKLIKYYKLTIILVICSSILCLGLMWSMQAEAADLNASEPASYTSSESQPIEINLPAQPLDVSLKQLANTSGMSIAFDSALASGKTAPAINGRMSRTQALNRLLLGSGLNATIDGESAVVKAIYDPNAVKMKLNEVTVRAKRFQNVGLLPGLNLTKEQIPGNIQSVSAQEIKEAHALSLSDLLNSKLQSVNVNDYQGNPFQMDVTYRGFTASPQLGTPQGLSIFFDGIRVNEPFGDVVNWDLIPMNALDGFDVFPGSNPLFGLNTLGGAISMKTKSGFTTQGVTADVLTGSYGRRQLQASAGINNANKDEGSWDVGDFAAFGAINVFLEDGWRKNSPSEVNQAFGKLEWQGERASLAFTTLGAVNKLVGNGTVPQEFYREDPTSVFTSPDKTDNKLLQFQLSGVFDVTDTFNVTGMVYKRNSNRHANSGDIIDQETFSNGTKTYDLLGGRLPNSGGPSPQCAYLDRDGNGIPDYYVIDEADAFVYYEDMTNGRYRTNPAFRFDDPIPVLLEESLKNTFKDKLYGFKINYEQALPGYNDVYAVFDFLTATQGFGLGNPFIGADGSTKYMFAAAPVNDATCQTHYNDLNQGMLPDKPYQTRDGGRTTTGTGVIKGTPTAVITDTNIKQSTTGGGVQLNWNLDNHKFMLGASVDRAGASYVGSQRLGIMDNDRNVFNDPNLIGEEFYAAANDIVFNDFSGTSTTKSVYFSETWIPTQTLNLSLSGRFNKTDINNTLMPSLAESGLENKHLLNQYPLAVICPGTDLSNCPWGLDGPIPANVYWDGLVLKNLLAQGQLPSQLDSIKNTDKKQHEKFSYRSFNPSLGGTWQAKPNLNLYANWNQGTRTPSVIELGCAYDGTLVPWSDEYGNPYPGPNGGPQLIPRSLQDGRGCKLPSTLSGDPYLPQVKAQTMEIGARGKFSDFLEWNVSAYRTDLKDDIYLTSLVSELSFFQSIGDTRRQGIEFGLAGQYGKSDFRMNYSLTEATFQSAFKTFSPHNSSRSLNGSDLNQIQVKPGNVMPGVPFNNLNFNWGYRFTPKLKMNWTLVAHSDSFLRGNENNAHTPSPSRTTSTVANDYSGKAPGYAVLNFNAKYDLGRGWAASVLVNNVLDKEYYTAGRLGVNPFSPSTFGAIGPGGFNYNSNEWISSQLISPGAPRGIWLSLSYDFDASKKGQLPPSRITEVEPDRTELPLTKLPSAQELALARALNGMKSLPVIKLNQKQASAAAQAAEQEVKASVETWRRSLAANDADALIGSYAKNYEPAGRSREQWQEQQKLRFITDAIQTAEVSDLIVAPQGLRMLAIFSHRLSSTQQQQSTRKVLTFEQREGQWLIINENNLAAPNTASSKPVTDEMTHVDGAAVEQLSVRSPRSNNMKAKRVERIAQVEMR